MLRRLAGKRLCQDKRTWILVKKKKKFSKDIKMFCFPCRITKVKDTEVYMSTVEIMTREIMKSL